MADEAEAGLDANQLAVHIVIGRLEPVVDVAILPGGDAAPADDAWVQPSLVKEEPAGGGAQVGTLKVTQIARGIEPVGFLLHGLRVGILAEDNVAVTPVPDCVYTDSAGE